MRYRSVLVEWRDAFSTTGWCDKADADHDFTVWSNGYLIKKDRRRIVLAMSVSASGAMADLLTIPRGWIVRIRRAR